MGCLFIMRQWWGDNHDRMKAVIASALDRSDVVILSGGLGPTEDDLTKEVCAEVMGLPLRRIRIPASVLSAT